MLWPDEALLQGVVQEGDQPVVVPRNVEQAAGFALQSQLGPGHNPEELVQRADSPGQGDESLPQAGYDGLSLLD